MNETINLILSLSLSGSILAILIFAIKPLIKNKFSKSVQYYIWLVVLLRLIIPFSFEGSIMNGLFYTGGTPAAVSVNTAGEPDSVLNGGIGSSIIPDVSKNVANGVYNGDTDHSRYLRDLFSQYALYLWLFGILISLSVNSAGYIRFSIYLKRGNKSADDGQKRILGALLNGRCNVRIVRNRFVTTPMLIGLLKPCIMIPDADFSGEQLKNILLHEITHLRRRDIAIKWLTMIAASVHWFNPLMHFIKKDVNRACELACDETVIKNLDPAEKQAYGETLISVVAEQEYSFGVLQATMCEEKRSLRERLVAIMNHNKKSGPIMALSVILLATAVIGAVALGASVGTTDDKPPVIYISAEEVRTKAALTGSYSWKYHNTNIQADTANPVNFKYTIDNTVDATTNQQIIIGTQKIKSDKKYNFTIDSISVYKDGKVSTFESPEPGFINGNFYLQTPPDPGEYIYILKLNFKDKGTVEYGFVVRADMLTYNLAAISKNKTPYTGNSSKVIAIAGNLPVPDKYFMQQYISLKTKKEPYGLTIYYEAASDAQYEGAWPIVTPGSSIESNSRKNALVVFCMIDNLSEVTFAFRNSKSNGKLEESLYDTTFSFTRASFEKEYGDLSVLGKDLNLLQDALSEKTTSSY